MDMVREDGWSELFWAAFRQSRNPMVLVDDARVVVEVNAAFLTLLGYGRDEVIGQPAHSFVISAPLSAQEWAERLAIGHFAGETELLRSNGSSVLVQWGVDTKVGTGRRLVLLVALSTSRWGRHSRRSIPTEHELGELSEREREVVRLVAVGHTGPEIADELHIATDTARTHVRNAMTKLGARSRAHLVAKTLGDGRVLG